MMSRDELTNVINECLDRIEAKKNAVKETVEEVALEESYTDDIDSVNEDSELVLVATTESLDFECLGETFNIVLEFDAKQALITARNKIMAGLKWLKDKFLELASKFASLFKKKGDKSAEGKAKEASAAANKIGEAMNKLKEGGEDAVKTAGNLLKSGKTKLEGLANSLKSSASKEDKKEEAPAEA